MPGDDDDALVEQKTPSPGAAFPFRLVEHEQPSPEVYTPSERHEINKAREKTRAGLAWALLGLLGVFEFMILITTLAFGYSVQDAKELLALVVTPLVGLVGAATGFYYGGKEGQ